MTPAPALIDRYFFRTCARLFLVLGGIVLVILLVERLVRIVELIANTEDGGIASFRMILDLVPHYLQLAIPAALFLAMIITVDRVSRSGELVTMLAAGLSLRRLSRAFFALALIAAPTALVISGFIAPLARYDYRQTVHNVQTESFRAAFQEGRFVRYGRFTVWTDFRDFSGTQLGETFILESRPDGDEVYVSAPHGEMIGMDAGGFALRLEAGRGDTVSTGHSDLVVDSIEFERMTWPISTEKSAFRMRGDDERELMLTELPDPAAFSNVDPRAAHAAFHDRISRACLLLVLPLLAVPLGLNLSRKPRSSGLVLGIVSLLVIQKALESGLHMAATGTLPVWAGSWPVPIAVGLVGLILFVRASGDSPLDWFRPGRGDIGLHDDGLVLASDTATR